ncbi:MAG: hypothetical protein VCE43_19085, partial [Myxococcota bacterium]
VTAIDEDGNQDTASVSITVTEFAGAETLCVQDNVSGSLTGCPSGATTRTEGNTGYTNVAQAVETALTSSECAGGTAPCQRVLFQGGGTFTMTSGVSLNGDTLHVGSYGAGKFTLDLAGSAPTQFFDVTGDDVRISDFSVVVGTRSAGSGSLLTIAGNPTSDSDYILILNADSANTRDIANIPGKPQGEFQAFTLPNVVGFFELNAANCGNDGGNCFFTAVQKIAIVGSLVSDSRNGEHLVRLNHAGEDADSTGGAFIYANRFELPASRKHAITTRVGNIRCTVVKNWGGDFWGEQVIIANNHFESNSQATVDIGQGNGCCLARQNCSGPEDEPKHRDNIVEGNFFTVRTTPDIGAVNLISPRVLHIHTDLTVRNNAAIMEPSNINASFVGIAVENGEIYNNAIYGGSNADDNQNVVQNANGLGCVVQNNVAWGPRGARVFEGTACSNLSSHNWQKNAAGTGTSQLSACPFATCPPVTLQDFRIRTNDPDGLVNGGTKAPVKADVFQRIRPGDLSWDVGPHEKNAVGIPPTTPTPTLLPPILLE